MYENNEHAKRNKFFHDVNAADDETDENDENEENEGIM